MDIHALRNTAIDQFMRRLGMGESPPGSNRGVLPDECFHHVHGPDADPVSVSTGDREWCAECDCYMLWLAGVRNGPRTASTGGIHDWGVQHEKLGALPALPSPGDTGCILASPEHPTKTGFCHTVMILGGPPHALKCIAGNEHNCVAYSIRDVATMKVVNPYVLG